MILAGSGSKDAVLCSTSMSTQFFFALLDFEVFIQLSILQGAVIPVENLPIFQKNTKTDVAVCSVKRLTISMMPALQVRAPPVKCICLLAPSCKKKGVGNLHPYFITSIPVTSFQKSDGINQYGCQQRFRACWVNLTSVLSVECLPCISKLFLRCILHSNINRYVHLPMWRKLRLENTSAGST